MSPGALEAYEAYLANLDNDVELPPDLLQPTEPSEDEFALMYAQEELDAEMLAALDAVEAESLQPADRPTRRPTIRPRPPPPVFAESDMLLDEGDLPPSRGPVDPTDTTRWRRRYHWKGEVIWEKQPRCCHGRLAVSWFGRRDGTRIKFFKCPWYHTKDECTYWEWADKMQMRLAQAVGIPLETVTFPSGARPELRPPEQGIAAPPEMIDPVLRRRAIDRGVHDPDSAAAVPLRERSDLLPASVHFPATHHPSVLPSSQASQQSQASQPRRPLGNRRPSQAPGGRSHTAAPNFKAPSFTRPPDTQPARAQTSSVRPPVRGQPSGGGSCTTTAPTGQSNHKDGKDKGKGKRKRTDSQEEEQEVIDNAAILRDMDDDDIMARAAEILSNPDLAAEARDFFNGVTVRSKAFSPQIVAILRATMDAEDDFRTAVHHAEHTESQYLEAQAQRNRLEDVLAASNTVQSYASTLTEDRRTSPDIPANRTPPRRHTPRRPPATPHPHRTARNATASSSHANDRPIAGPSRTLDPLAAAVANRTRSRTQLLQPNPLDELSAAFSRTGSRRQCHSPSQSANHEDEDRHDLPSTSATTTSTHGQGPAPSTSSAQAAPLQQGSERHVSKSSAPSEVKRRRR
ncbi:hypothetical protein CALCODRAFT_505571 [Calocera cornea HHB12733]|uniref:Uncharacterized protein n=1 Tax=Calocera cornea HHB12733 TaxID=1353952 RepID=A0A165K1L5_9BASI|nr:hypothetical protein CALCODRAFT_505571 [Calocera cornea HHB12733]